MTQPDRQPTDLHLDAGECARACHRIVRAMHDGECPRCHGLFTSEQMQTAYELARSVRRRHPWENLIGHRCPNCAFEIAATESAAVIAEFGDYMTKSLAIFEQWREEWRKSQ